MSKKQDATEAKVVTDEKAQDKDDDVPQAFPQRVSTSATIVRYAPLFSICLLFPNKSELTLSSYCFLSILHIFSHLSLSTQPNLSSWKF